MPYRRVSKANPCPVCNHADWCLVSTDGELAICPRVMEGSIRYIDSAGYLHRVAESKLVRTYYRRPRREDRYAIDANKIAYECHARMGQEQLIEFADELGVSAESLEELMVGWHGKLQAYTFPMRDGMSNIIGIRTRHDDGSKRAVAGSKAGLFIPASLAKGSIYICEGPTDAAAMLTLGFAAIGRPSCMGSHRQVIQFLNNTRRDVVIVADNDGPGRNGALKLREAIGVGRIVSPPANYKDIRERVKEVISRLSPVPCDLGS